MGAVNEGKGPILIVEDDPDIRDTIAQILEGEGFSTVVADNGKRALEVLASTPEVQLILLDLMMPVMDGWSFRAAQREDAKIADIPVVVISADGDLRRQAAQIGVDGYLRKPLGIDALLEIAARYCP